MFGHALLVSPVVQAGARVRTVYLPAATAWYDFWTGEQHPGAQVISVKADLATVPLYVRAGSILPLGPVKPYADAPSEEPMEIRVYPGDDGVFEFYDDEGDGFGYEQGRYTTVQFAWDDKRRLFEIGARRGRFPGMPVNQRLRIVCGAGDAHSTVVLYRGEAVKVGLEGCQPVANRAPGPQ
jgi:alpha-D-xyloside xylohydrolase